MSAPYKIVVYPHPALRQKAEPVQEVDDTVRQIMLRMRATLQAEESGIGLSANQVAVLQRIILVDQGLIEDNPSLPLHMMVNPEVIEASDEQDAEDEACLSLPGVHMGPVIRPQTIVVTYLDIDGQAQKLKVTGYTARCILHEIDHLNGVLFIDHLNAAKRTKALRILEKEKRRLKKEKS